MKTRNALQPVESSLQTTPTKLLGGTSGKGFLPGKSGNPGGRPKGLASRIRKMTNEGRDILDFLVGVIQSRKEPTKYKLAAAHELLDRGWGKPTQPIESTNDHVLRIEVVRDEEWFRGRTG